MEHNYLSPKVKEQTKKIILERTTVNKIISPIIIIFATLTYFNAHLSNNEGKILPLKNLEVIPNSIFNKSEMKIAGTASILPLIIDSAAGTAGVVTPYAGFGAFCLSLSVEIYQSGDRSSWESLESMSKHFDNYDLFCIILGSLIRFILEENSKNVKRKEFKVLMTGILSDKNKFQKIELIQAWISEIQTFRDGNEQKLINPQKRRANLIVSLLQEEMNKSCV